MTEDEFAKFAPFAAINEFMRPDFRLHIIDDTLKNLAVASEKNRKLIEMLLREQLSIPGFRNALKAPRQMLAKSSVEIFEKSSEFASAILFGWMEINHLLALNVFDLLNEEGWQILDLDVDRTMLPGFFTNWPENYDFEVFLQLYARKYHEESVDDDEISLMIVLVSMRLPYEINQSDN